MEISILDKSNYLKGLLIIAKKDNKLAEQEKEIIRHCAQKLGFARSFYEDTLKYLLENKFITEEPIIFSDRKIAESFIVEGLKLAYSDNAIIGREIEWLKSVAIKNNIDEKWFADKLKNLKDSEITICNAE